MSNFKPDIIDSLKRKGLLYETSSKTFTKGPEPEVIVDYSKIVEVLQKEYAEKIKGMEKTMLNFSANSTLLASNSFESDKIFSNLNTLLAASIKIIHSELDISELETTIQKSSKDIYEKTKKDPKNNLLIIPILVGTLLNLLK